MKTTRKLALVLAALTILFALPYTAFAAGFYVDEVATIIIIEPSSSTKSASTGSSSTTATASSSNAAAATTASAPASVSSKYAEYLKSTSEISFYDGGSVAKKAASLCKDKKTTKDKVLAMYNYIAANFTYDYTFADNVRAGRITTYTPDTASILSNKKGVCYDFSALFAAMCRSQGIPAKLCKGYSTRIDGYHAWNTVYIAESDTWYSFDLTFPCCLGTGKVKTFAKATVDSSKYTTKTAS